MHVGSTGCPSLCAALIYPGSGFPENPQISVKHNQPPPLPRRAAGAYSVLLHKSHCNLCCVISGFRCLPLSTEGQAIPQIQHGRKVTGLFYSFFCHVDFFFNVSFLIQAYSELLDLESLAHPLKYSSGWKCAARWLRNLSSPLTRHVEERASRIVAEHLAFRALSGEVHGFSSVCTQSQHGSLNQADPGHPVGGKAQRRASACTALPSSVTTDAKEWNVVKEWDLLSMPGV